MKIASIKFLAVILFSAIVIVPLRAQTNAPAENGTNSPVAVTDNTGVHIGGQKPAGKKVPALVEIHGSEKTGLEDVAALMVIFGTFVAIVAMGLYFRYRREKLTHETLLAMIEKGMPITPELLNRLTGKRRPGSPLFLGLLMTGIGTAMLIPNCSSGGRIGFARNGMGRHQRRMDCLVYGCGVPNCMVCGKKR